MKKLSWESSWQNWCIREECKSLGVRPVGCRRSVLQRTLWWEGRVPAGGRRMPTVRPQSAQLPYGHRTVPVPGALSLWWKSVSEVPLLPGCADLHGLALCRREHGAAWAAWHGAGWQWMAESKVLVHGRHCWVSWTLLQKKPRRRHGSSSSGKFPETEQKSLNKADISPTRLLLQAATQVFFWRVFISTSLASCLPRISLVFCYSAVISCC